MCTHIAHAHCSPFSHDFSHTARHITTSTPTKPHILRYVPRMVGRGCSIVFFLLLVDLVTQCLLAFIFVEVIEVWLIFVSLFEDLDPLPYYWYC